jgi:hypothetical protein
MYTKSFSLAILSLLFASACSLRTGASEQISILNPSFELPAQWDGSFSVGVITGWTLSPGATAGVQNPTDGMFSGTSDPLQGMPDGKQSAWLNTVGSISQQLSATLQPSTEYTLTVSVGDRRDDAVGAYSVELYAGTNLLGAASSPTVDDGFVTATVKYTARPSDLFLNQPLGIVLAKVATISGEQVNFDNVVLTGKPSVPPVSTDGLVAHWRFDESSGLIAHTARGGCDGVLTATGAVFDSGGVSGNALKLDRTQNGMVLVTNLVGLVTNDFSVVAWMKVLAGDTTPDTILLSAHEAWAHNGFLLQLNETAGSGAPSKATLVVNDGVHTLTSSTSVDDGNWHQIVTVCAKGGQTALYVDGSPAEAALLSPSVTDRNPPFILGGAYGRVTHGVANGYYSGWIDDVQIYNRVLTDTQIDTLFVSPGKSLGDLESALSVKPSGGSFVGSVEVSFTSTIPGAKVRFTVDGSEPLASSSAYTIPFSLTESATLKARLFVNKFPVSEVVSATFTKLPAISFEPAGELFTNRVDLSLLNNVGLGVVVYATDGGEPTVSSTPYSAPFTLTSAALIKARVFVGGFPASEVCVASFARVYAVEDGIPSAWRERFFGAGYLTDPRVAADADPDGDGWKNLIEYQNGTDPTDKGSHPDIVAGIRAIPLVSWNSLPGLTYRVLRKSSASAPNWDTAQATFSATGTNSVYIDPDATPTTIYLIEMVP